MRESVRLESKRRRVRERYLKKDLTPSFLEADEDLEENEVWVVVCVQSSEGRVHLPHPLEEELFSLDNLSCSTLQLQFVLCI